MIPWLDLKDDFPPVTRALADPNGLLCAGADLSPERLLHAYRNGIFPWFSPGEPILWWSPEPRMVLVPSEFRISHSLRKRLRRADYRVELDADFAAVIHACAQTPRHGQRGTWITAEMQDAYGRLFELGHAHSVEIRIGGRLVGGLYGVSIGRMFYGESMFSHQTDASKLAAAHLARYLAAGGYPLIDCQMSTPHLASLGARELPRREFVARVRELAAAPSPPARWPRDGASGAWTSV